MCNMLTCRTKRGPDLKLQGIERYSHKMKIKFCFTFSHTLDIFRTKQSLLLFCHELFLYPWLPQSEKENKEHKHKACYFFSLVTSYGSWNLFAVWALSLSVWYFDMLNLLHALETRYYLVICFVGTRDWTHRKRLSVKFSYLSEGDSWKRNTLPPACSLKSH